MGNIIDSVASGFTKAIADILAKPLDFLSGKTCRYLSIYLPIYPSFKSFCCCCCLLTANSYTWHTQLSLRFNMGHHMLRRKLLRSKPSKDGCHTLPPLSRYIHIHTHTRVCFRIRLDKSPYWSHSFLYIYTCSPAVLLPYLQARDM